MSKSSDFYGESNGITRFAIKINLGTRFDQKPIRFYRGRNVYSMFTTKLSFFSQMDVVTKTLSSRGSQGVPRRSGGSRDARVTTTSCKGKPASSFQRRSDPALSRVQVPGNQTRLRKFVSKTNLNFSSKSAKQRTKKQICSTFSYYIPFPSKF